MPKIATIYSPSELAQLDRDELYKIVLRESERLNRQISRAKKRGDDLSTVFTQEQLQRPARSTLKDMTSMQLVQEYTRAQKAAGSAAGYTQAGISARQREKEELARDLGVKASDVTAEDLEYSKKVRSFIEDSGVFYQVLVKAVNTGVAEDYNFFRNDERTETEEGRKAFVKSTIRAINKKIAEENAKTTGEKQKRFSTATAKKLANKQVNKKIAKESAYRKSAAYIAKNKKVKK